jgi:putative copper export protein
VTSLDLIKWVHLLGAAVWTGGLITLAALVVALRRAGADRTQLQAAARQFGRVSWTALGLIVATGIWQVERIGLSWTYGRLIFKLVLVGTVAVLAFVHQLTAKQTSAAVRGALQGISLVLSVGIFGAATRLL